MQRHVHAVDSFNGHPNPLPAHANVNRGFCFFFFSRYVHDHRVSRMLRVRSALAVMERSAMAAVRTACCRLFPQLSMCRCPVCSSPLLSVMVDRYAAALDGDIVIRGTRARAVLILRSSRENACTVPVACSAPLLLAHKTDVKIDERRED